MERILFRNEGWIGRLAASRAAHFFYFFIQYWYARGSVVLILRSEKWPFSVAPWLWNGWLYVHEASAHVPGRTCGTGSWVLWCMYEMDVVFNQHDMDFFLHITAKRLCEWPRNNDYIQWTCSTHSWPEIFWYCYTKALWRRDFLVFSILLLKANFFVYVAVVAVFLICKILRYWYTVVHTCDLLSEISAL